MASFIVESALFFNKEFLGQKERQHFCLRALSTENAWEKRAPPLLFKGLFGRESLRKKGRHHCCLTDFVHPRMLEKKEGHHCCLRDFSAETAWETVIFSAENA